MGLDKNITGIYPSKFIRLLLPFLTGWYISADNYYHNFLLFSVSSDFHGNMNSKKNILNFNSFRKRSLLLVMLSHTVLARKILEECNCIFSPLYLQCNKQVMILYPYFVCEVLVHWAIFMKTFHFVVKYFSILPTS